MQLHPVSPEENKLLVRRFYEEIDRGNIDALDQLLTADYLDHSPPPFPVSPGRDGVKEAFRLFLTATPGHHRIDDQIAEGDKVVTGSISYKPGSHCLIQQNTAKSLQLELSTQLDALRCDPDL
jgi:ketosteroid isomerase-like protein